jgi:hypothetical protein
MDSNSDFQPTGLIDLGPQEAIQLGIPGPHQVLSRSDQQTILIAVLELFGEALDADGIFGALYIVHPEGDAPLSTRHPHIPIRWNGLVLQRHSRSLRLPLCLEAHESLQALESLLDLFSYHASSQLSLILAVIL